MALNIACFVPGCKNPVIGQCPGYRKNCGHFYCAEHSNRKLCAECAEEERAELLKRAEDERIQLQEQAEKEGSRLAEQAKYEAAQRLYEDYSKTAMELSKIGSSELKELFVVMILFLIIFVMLASLSVVGHDGNNAVMAIDWIVGVGVSGFLVMVISDLDLKRKSSKDARIADISVLKPGFAEFYEEWGKQKNREQSKNTNDAMKTAGKIALIIGLIGLAAVAGAAVESSEDSRIRRAVDDELNRHGL